MSVIKVENLSRDYGRGHGVFGVSFEVNEGEVFGFLGPNGAGKTTTIRHLMGFIKPQSGSCAINGLDCWKDGAAIQKDLGYIPGEMSLFDDMTGLGYLKFIAKYRGMKGEGRKQELIDRFELDAHVKFKKMSKGMKQKVGIVAAFMHDPKIIILDEPTSGLDPLMQNHFIELVFEEKAKGKTILMSSHMFEEVERTCHRIGVIKDGKLIEVASVDELKEKQTKKYVVTFANSQASADFAKELSNSTALTNHRVEVTVQNNIGEFIAAMAKYPVTNLYAPQQNLEDIFLQYYGGGVNV